MAKWPPLGWRSSLAVGVETVPSMCTPVWFPVAWRMAHLLTLITQPLGLFMPPVDLARVTTASFTVAVPSVVSRPHRSRVDAPVSAIWLAPPKISCVPALPGTHPPGKGAVGSDARDGVPPMILRPFAVHTFPKLT